jgi:hypothetical protein
VAGLRHLRSSTLRASRVVGDFARRYAAALESDDKVTLNTLDLFRKDVSTYVRLYDFMSQIVDYGDPYMEMLSIFLGQRNTARRGAPSGPPGAGQLPDGLVDGRRDDQGLHGICAGRPHTAPQATPHHS